MSRIGKLPIAMPSGVKANILPDIIKIEGPKGSLAVKKQSGVKVVIDSDKIVVTLDSNSSQARANWGTMRAHLNNMVKGVTLGWKKGLELNGVGYNAKIQGQVLVLAVGFSHDVKFGIPTGLKCNVVKNVIEMESADRELLGTFAAKVRKVKPPEPYLGKGIRYLDEVVRRKAGKTGKK